MRLSPKLNRELDITRENTGGAVLTALGVLYLWKNNDQTVALNIRHSAKDDHRFARVIHAIS